MILPKSSIKYATLITFLIILFISLVGYFIIYPNKQSTQYDLAESVAIPEQNQVPSEMDNWKTYSNRTLSFKYPPTFTQKYPGNPTILFNSSNQVEIYITEESTMMNECMVELAFENKSGFVVRKFEDLVTKDSDACSAKVVSVKEAWAVQTSQSYGPGIQISYPIENEQLINQIISTVRFK